MRVLQVSHGFPPRQRGGAEIFARGLSLELVERGHEVSVFHPVADPEQPDLQLTTEVVDGLSLFRLNNLRRPGSGDFSTTYRNPGIDRVFAGVLDKQRPDVVHFHHLVGLSADLIAGVHERGIPIVFTLHDYWLICQRGQFLRADGSLCSGQENAACAECFSGVLGATGLSTSGLGRLLQRWFPAALQSRNGLRAALSRVIRRSARGRIARQPSSLAAVEERMSHIRALCAQVDRFVAPSRFLRERFLEFGLPEARVVYSRYGFDPEPFSEGSDPVILSPHGERLRFGFLGSLIRPKGLHTLIDAFLGLRSESASLEVWGLAAPYDGDTSYAVELERRARTDGRIRFRGAYRNQDVATILAGLDVLVFPSIWYENSPLTIQEALLAGVPVIATDLGAMPELVRDGRNGLLFVPRSSADLRSKMERCLDEEGLLERLRPTGTQVKRMTESAIEYEAMYTDLQQSAL